MLRSRWAVNTLMKLQNAFVEIHKYNNNKYNTVNSNKVNKVSIWCDDPLASILRSSVQSCKCYYASFTMVECIEWLGILL